MLGPPAPVPFVQIAYNAHDRGHRRKLLSSSSRDLITMQSLVVTHDLEDFAYRPPNTWMGLPSHTATACAWLLAEMTALVGACASEYVARTQDGRADRSHHGNRLVLALAWTVVTFAAIRAALTDMGTCATTTTTLVKLLLYLQLALNPLRSLPKNKKKMSSVPTRTRMPRVRPRST